ncbi:uncharacterized protein LOC105914899 [Setaria italica]|uniref:uncharacterized protein LOC105914899 n=1 Tax=Setaria italica TaxID=4555 RepID=UPI000BE57799|nr:uncharacterized protein LOC105914899 [Setaria italica]
MNPQDTNTSEAVGIESSAKLIIEADELMKSESKGKTDRWSLLQSIWNNQFTSYGFAHLCNDVPEGVVCLLYRDERINVLYKHKGMLHVVVTAQDVLQNYPDALWRKLEKGSTFPPQLRQLLGVAAGPLRCRGFKPLGIAAGPFHDGLELLEVKAGLLGDGLKPSLRTLRLL